MWTKSSRGIPNSSSISGKIPKNRLQIIRVLEILKWPSLKTSIMCFIIIMQWHSFHQWPAIGSVFPVNVNFIINLENDFTRGDWFEETTSYWNVKLLICQHVWNKTPWERNVHSAVSFPTSWATSDFRYLCRSQMVRFQETIRVSFIAEMSIYGLLAGLFL